MTTDPKPTHTPGQFEAQICGPNDQSFCTYAFMRARIRADGKTVAYLPELGSEDTNSEVCANAFLFAAASDLFAVCQSALKALEEMSTEQFALGGDKPIRDSLASAIAKAKGIES